MICVR